MTSGTGFVLPVDKPAGPTSHDVVVAARRALGTRRVGHTGTLDPFASGLLLLCVGHATRLAEYLTRLEKTYETTALLGIATDTHDREGAVVTRSASWSALTTDQIAAALAHLVGELEQVPPQYSAKKVGGVAMHRRARRGEVVELQPSPVTVYDIELEAVDLPEVRFRVRCSSGVYIRSLARDLGNALDVGAHLTALRRVAVGSFRVENAVPLERLTDAEEVARRRLGPLAALAHLPELEIDSEGAQRLARGQRVRLAGDAPRGWVAVASGGALVAVAEVDDGVLRPRKVFAP